ncbi:SGNH/GDSL hydrolase family protein [Actinomycetospora endophytica]|uniref:SGNH/GDSL hydrolase family protein n=1 Tax=Actinomycetospora endophytica TaxID=2291215 RepID=UPI0035561A57
MPNAIQSRGFGGRIDSTYGRCRAWKSVMSTIRVARASVWVLVVLSVGLSCWLLLRPNDKDARESTVAFVGDSYFAGTKLGGIGRSNIASLLAGRFGWNSLNAAVGGTGYAHASSTSPPYALAQLPAVLSHDPSLILVEGSINDGHAEPASAEAAAKNLYAVIAGRLPGVRIVVVGPISPGRATGSLAALDDAMRRAANSCGLPYIDASGEDWLPAGIPGLIGSDGVHPTDAGHQRMATLLGDDLVRLGVVSAEGDVRSAANESLRCAGA